MNRAKKALIVGGGVAGPVAAMALQRAGMDSVVYEAHAGGADDVGAFLTFASNGLDALRAIDAHGLVLAAMISEEVGESSNRPLVAACRNMRLGSVGPGMEQNQRSQTANSRARVVRIGTCSGLKHCMISGA